MSQWFGGAAVPPPPGVEPDFVNPQNHMKENVALHAVFLTAVTLCVAMRLYTRFFVACHPGWDDFLIFMTYCFTVTFSGLLLKSYTWGIGRHMWEMPAMWLTEALKWFAIAVWFYVLLITTCKLAILAIYWRIFTIDIYVKRAIIIGFVFVVCANTALFFASVFLCNPPSKSWDTSKPGKCGAPKPVSYYSGAINVAEDLYLLLLPLPFLSRMNMRLSRKLRIIGVFGLGIFACVASTLRLAKTKIMVSSLDYTWNSSEMAVWAVNEGNVSLICGCLMLLPAFLERHWPKSASDFFSRSFSMLRSSNLSKQRSAEGFVRTSSDTHIGLRHNGSDTHSKISQGEKEDGAGHIMVTHDVEMSFINRRSTGTCLRFGKFVDKGQHRAGLDEAERVACERIKRGLERRHERCCQKHERQPFHDHYFYDEKDRFPQEGGSRTHSVKHIKTVLDIAKYDQREGSFSWIDPRTLSSLFWRSMLKMPSHGPTWPLSFLNARAK